MQFSNDNYAILHHELNDIRNEKINKVFNLRDNNARVSLLGGNVRRVVIMLSGGCHSNAYVLPSHTADGCFITRATLLLKYKDQNLGIIS